MIEQAFILAVLRLEIGAQVVLQTHGGALVSGSRSVMVRKDDVRGNQSRKRTKGTKQSKSRNVSMPPVSTRPKQFKPYMPSRVGSESPVSPLAQDSAQFSMPGEPASLQIIVRVSVVLTLCPFSPYRRSSLSPGSVQAQLLSIPNPRDQSSRRDIRSFNPNLQRHEHSAMAPTSRSW